MKTGSESQQIPEVEVIRLLREMRLEAAIRLLRGTEGEVDSAAVKAMIMGYETQASRMQAEGETGAARRLARRAAALNELLVHGPQPARMVAETELPEGYVGRILLVLLTGGGFDDTVCLRSGDGWHREILHNTRAEIADLGFPHAQVHPLGGAYAGFDSDGSVVIWGTSDEYGCCDKEQAARLIARVYPEKTVRVEE
jgi:Janus/Ocnus family (Ocnus)